MLHHRYSSTHEMETIYQYFTVWTCWRPVSNLKHLIGWNGLVILGWLMSTNIIIIVNFLSIDNLYPDIYVHHALYIMLIPHIENVSFVDRMGQHWPVLMNNKAISNFRNGKYTEPKKKLSPSLIVDMLVQFQSFWLKAYIFVK
jgi:hypothetical protein